MIDFKFVWRTLKPFFLSVVAMLVCQQPALAEENTQVEKTTQMEMTTQVEKSRHRNPLIKPPKIAVTDLSYDEKVRERFQDFEYKGKHNHHSSSRNNNMDSDHSSSGNSSGHNSSSSDESIKYSDGYKTTIERGELRKFTADVKGELLKAGYKLVQGKPWTQKETENLYDIIERIKQGYYPGADYVLFGSINNVEFSRDDTPIQGSDAFAHALSLNLVAEFSLISTRTYEISAAFSAMGEGSDMKMTKAPIAGEARHASLTLNRSRVIQDVSRSLGVAVAHEVQAQFNEDSSSETVVEEKTIIFKR